jgi:Sel1 repeat
MKHRLTLDVPSLQKLLEAAWVIQCQRDRELNQLREAVTLLAVPSGKEDLNPAHPLTSPTEVREPARAAAEAQALQVSERVNQSVVPAPLPVTPIHQRAAVTGALALALRNPIPFLSSEVCQEAAPEKSESAATSLSRRVTLHLVWFGDKYRVGLRLVPFRDEHKNNEHALARWAASVFKHASRATTAYAGPLVVLAIMLAFVFSLLGSHRPSLTAVNAAPPAPKIAVDAPPTHDSVSPAQPTAPVPVAQEASHQRVTDPAASSLVAGLSPFEIKTVRQQAQYGDDVAALTLGMAYEIGRHVPQSCTQAAHWVAVAAEEGNAAAQYNLALRYVSGDGTPADLDEARKWFKAAAAHGYQKARVTLQASGL